MKARDIIPGWPRGRSTSKLWHSLARSFVLHGRIALWPFDFGLQDDVRFRNDVRCERAEERRKADMMETHYGLQRIDAQGPLWREGMGEKWSREYVMPHLEAVLSLLPDRDPGGKTL
jgi:hypothetical protein